MAIKIMQVELMENNAFIELEVEETMELKVVIAKLRSLGHLPNDKDYYIKNPDGTSIWEGNQIKVCKENRLIITTEKDWKPQLIFSGGFADMDEVNGNMILNDDTYWILPFLNKALWNDFGGGSHLFLLENIFLYDEKSINIRVLVQYSVINIQIVNSVNNTECANKMQQVLLNIVDNEKSREQITINNLHEKIEDLAVKMKYYLTTHTELKWGTKIDAVLILGIDINN